MTLGPDGLPTSEVYRIDAEIRERIGSYLSGSPQADDLVEIERLDRRRDALTKPKLFDEARAIFAEIAAAG